jgi:hypothetical protein
MKTSHLPRHQIIKSRLADHSENAADVAVNLWTQLASQLISIVGEGGFDSLYARSVFLSQSKFPWLSTDLSFDQPDHRFAELKSNLEKQSSVQASEASILLLITFTDILVTLIGEQLASSILRSAWGNDASDRAGKEFKNE